MDPAKVVRTALQNEFSVALHSITRSARR